MIIWLSGVSGVGKTTIAKSLVVNKPARYIYHTLLDADVIRNLAWPELGLSVEDRNKNVTRMARLASFLSQSDIDNNILVVVACIAPFREVRNEALNICKDFTITKHVYLHSPLIERIRRDPKGLYDRAINGCIFNLTGYDGRYDIPTKADLSINTAAHTIKEITNKIWDQLKE